MAELSKTARASMGKQVKEVHVETTEEAIKAIRDNRAAGLHIGDMSRVDKLLEAFDKILFANGELTNALNEETGKKFTLEKELQELKDTLKLAADFGVDSLTESQAAVGDIQMAAIPAQEHDEHHMTDFHDHGGEA